MAPSFRESKKSICRAQTTSLVSYARSIYVLGVDFIGQGRRVLYERETRCGKLISRLVQDGYLQMVAGEGDEEWTWSEAILDRDAWVAQQLRGSQITCTPEHERPRERLLAQGAEKLRTAELLAILIRSGRPGESALQAGEKIANRFGEQLDRMRFASAFEMKSISCAISEAAYCQILAGIELGRRVERSIALQRKAPQRIDSSRAAVEYCQLEFTRLMDDRAQEEFHIVTLDTKLQPIQRHCVTVGTLDASLVAPREVFRPAIRDAAAAILLIHNHPSGDPTPSRQDFQVTNRLDEAAKIIGIQVIDHIVVASRGCVSLRDLGAS